MLFTKGHSLKLKNTGKSVIILLIILLMNIYSCANNQHQLKNEKYSLQIGENGEMVVKGNNSEEFIFKPEFTVFYNQEDPGLALRANNSDYIKSSYNVPSWKVEEFDEEKFDEQGEVQVGDGFDPRILSGDTGGRTQDYYKCGSKAVLSAESFELQGDNITWVFPEHPSFELEATLRLNEENEEPIIQYKFTPKKEGYYSIGYTGAPAYAKNEINEIWQPYIWQEKRFPDQAYLTMAFRCPIPTTLLMKGNNTMGVIADPSEFPFQPLPLFDNSRFGVLLMNDESKYHPQLFSPVMGGKGSYMGVGDEFKFKMRLVVYGDKLSDAFPKIAQDVYQFKDYRHNVLGSLNDALENMIDYGMSEYSRFNEELRGCEYSTDVPGAVKNVSSLNPLSIALITDDPEIYQRRARPYIEYMISREKFLFVTDPSIVIQNPSWKMNGPCAPLSEMAALYEMTNKNNPLFLKLAKDLYSKERTLNLDTKVRGDNWMNSLALYKATKEEEYLTKAETDVKEYISERVFTPSKSFTDKFFGGNLFFWTTFPPNWIGLTDLYEVTGKDLYLNAAVDGAKRYSQFIWFSPVIPDEKVLVNKNGLAPHYWYLKSKGHKQMSAPEKNVEAWRVSAIGLTPESSGTCNGHRGIMMTNPIPWMLRLSHYSNYKFFYDVSRSAVIGRWMNFPGYHINTGRTTVYEAEDYPLKEHKELGYNSMHYNHIWPHMSMVLDYMISDAFVKSGGAVSFPGHFAEGYAYLQSKVYGDKPGKIYDHDNVWLWMPKDVIDVTNQELNYLTGYDKNQFFIVLMNQSKSDASAEVMLNETKIPFDIEKEYNIAVWKNNKKVGKLKLVDSKVEVETPAEGITVLVIDGIKVKPKFQNTFADQKTLGKESYKFLDYGKTHGTLMTIGKEYTTAYFYSQATFEEFKTVTFNYKIGSEWKKVKDDSFPFELTIDVPKRANKVEFFIEAVEIDGQKNKSEKAILAK